MKLLTAIIVLISVANIENAKLNNEDQKLPNQKFSNLFDETGVKLPNLKRLRRAFDKSENTAESDEDLMDKPEKDPNQESSEEKRMKLELGQKYTREFNHLLKMDGIELDQAIINQMNQSLVTMFAETMKETMARHNSLNVHPRYMLRTDFYAGFKAFQNLMAKRVQAWFTKIRQVLPAILVHDQHEKFSSPKGKEIYAGLIKHKCKALSRAIRSFINHHYTRLEKTFLKGVTFHVLTKPTTVKNMMHSTELFG